MSAGKYDFVVEQGATFEKYVVWKDGNGDVVDLTGYTARMQARAFTSSETVLAELTTENGGILIDLDRVNLRISAADTAAFTWVSARYDLELIDPTGRVTRLLEGTLAVSPEVTR